MKIRSRAPLRLGLAGGGTDVSPYSEQFGGCVLNATINMYAHSFIDTDVSTNQVIFEAQDLGITEIIDLNNPYNLEGKLILHIAVYKRVMECFNDSNYIPLRLITYCDAPPGSGLGSSSTMVISMLEGFRNLLGLPLGEYDLALLAYQIEREDCNLSGGKQDQYAATFGGFNFMEFDKNNNVIINPLRIRQHIICELESSLILYFTGVSRSSAKIINDQIRSIKKDNIDRLNAMHEVKKSAFKIKEFILKSDIIGVSSEFKAAWLAKKATSSSISNEYIDNIEYTVMKAGALSMKVSGAGGGGFIMIFVNPENKTHVIKSLDQFSGSVHKFEFTNYGAYSWII